MTSEVVHVTEHTYQTATNTAAVAMAMALLEHVETSIDTADHRNQLVYAKIKEARQSVRVTDKVDLYDHVHKISRELASALISCGHVVESFQREGPLSTPEQLDKSQYYSLPQPSVTIPSASSGKMSITPTSPSSLSTSPLRPEVPNGNPTSSSSSSQALPTDSKRASNRPACESQNRSTVSKPCTRTSALQAPAASPTTSGATLRITNVNPMSTLKDQASLSGRSKSSAVCNVL